MIFCKILDLNFIVGGEKLFKATRFTCVVPNRFRFSMQYSLFDDDVFDDVKTDGILDGVKWEENPFNYNHDVKYKPKECLEGRNRSWTHSMRTVRVAPWGSIAILHQWMIQSLEFLFWTCDIRPSSHFNSIVVLYSHEWKFKKIQKNSLNLLFLQFYDMVTFGTGIRYKPIKIHSKCIISFKYVIGH